jgi:hypothetical protein
MNQCARHVPPQTGNGGSRVPPTACVPLGFLGKTAETWAPPIRFERTTNALGKRRLKAVIPEDSAAECADVTSSVPAVYRTAEVATWSRSGRPRVDMHPTQVKLRWEAA